MIPRKKKICKLCGDSAYIFSKGRCRNCTAKSYPRYKKKYKPTGEAKLFQQIWNTRPHICTNCKEALGDEMRTFFFAHIKSKGAHPELRLLASNIMLHCFVCHRLYDQGTKEQYLARKKG